MVKENEKRAPALRISHIAYGRENRDGRVFYFVYPAGRSAEKDIPENVVLKRWRRRKKPCGYVFGGDRLSPNVWRALAIAFPARRANLANTEFEDLRHMLDAARGNLPDEYKLPSAECLKAMFCGIGPERVEALIARHTDPERKDKYGTPDLFLYMWPTNSPGAPFIRFVEVKKPEEALSDDQREEIEFLNSAGIPARVFRFIEPECPRTNGSPDLGT